ncbi:pseudouridine synthase, partial [Tribonema minus]
MTSATWGYSEYARHAYAPSDAAAWQVLVDVLGVDESRARYIIVFGGFYLMPPGDVKARRVSDPTHAMTKGQYMRIHPMPRQYPVCATTDWDASVLQENDWCMLVNKPAAVPSHPTVDNLHHNVVACLKPLRPGTQISAAHRLDVATSGLIVMCKRPSFMTAFSALHAAGAISKRYTALLRLPHVPLGVLTHYMMRSSCAPKIYR